MEYMWLVDLSNLLMNANALAMPLICFIFTHGFKDLFILVRFESNGLIIDSINQKEKLINI